MDRVGMLGNPPAGVIEPRQDALAQDSFCFEVNPASIQQDAAQCLGTHLLVELYDCDPQSLERVDNVERALVEAARASGASIVSHFFHEFQPYGVSGVVVIEESHYTVHTWPERGYAAVDLFFCSETVKPELALEALRDAFRPKTVSVMKVQRGMRSASSDG